MYYTMTNVVSLTFTAVRKKTLFTWISCEHAQQQYAIELCIFFFKCNLWRVIRGGQRKERKPLTCFHSSQYRWSLYWMEGFLFFFLANLIQAYSSNIRPKVMLLGIYIRNLYLCIETYISAQKYWVILQQLRQSLHRSICTWRHQTFTLSERSFEVRQSRGEKSPK